MAQQPTSTSATDGADGPRDDARYQIGEVADRTGVTQRTLRFYEEKGLLTPADRMDGGFRLYSDQDIDHIELIKRLQSLLNLSLAEIKEMVDAEALFAQMRATFRPDRDMSARKARVVQIRDSLMVQSEIIDRKMEQLREMGAVIDERMTMINEREKEIDEAIENPAVTPD
jgi:DNA-binding transcriptional MerR regulator